MITKDNVRKIARLARLKFSESELEVFASQLTGIEKMINEIQTVNCEQVDPLTSVNNANITMREDEVIVSDIREDLFKNVPGKDAEFAKEIKCFIVPKVVE